MLGSNLRAQSLILLCLSVTSPLFSLQSQLVHASEATEIVEIAPREIIPGTRLPQSNIPESTSFGEANQDLREVELRLVIKLSERRVYLYQGEQEINSYPVAIGKAGWETPTGNFQVIQMLRDPAWEHPWTGKIVPPGPDNPLGDRWIGFWTDGKNFIGFHGTPAEELVGQAVSHGCIRMKNNDVRALFEQVAVGTTVTVEP
ncbi:MAG: L,D-transpeptidase [Moorea sp. SIO2B7]|nr:L,D-transpeptidase [Moorena sp. SIO2B7]